MLEGPHSCALAADEAWGAEVPLSNGTRDGEDPDLKHQEDAPQQRDVGKGHKGRHPTLRLPHAAVHCNAFLTLTARLSEVPLACTRLCPFNPTGSMTSCKLVAEFGTQQ